jgi:hypothetical protein
MRFAKYVFLVAGVYGLLALAPQYFLESKIGADYPPPINHPEYFYGFVGVALAWQVVFLIISRDPARYRPIMLAAVIEKITFGVAAIVLYAQGRVPGAILGFGCIDLVLCALFAASYVATSPHGAASGSDRVMSER